MVLGDLAINTVIVIIVLKWYNGDFRHDAKYFFIGLPFLTIPKLGYGGMGIYMYLFFIGGYCLQVYYKNSYTSFIKYESVKLSV